MDSKNIPLAQASIDREDIEGVIDVLNSGRLASGDRTPAFERDFAAYVGSKYACAVSSGTAALHLAIKALEIGEGDEVITSPFSFIASTNCILYEKATPVFADINEHTLNIDASKIEALITPRTKAILPIHIFGQPADMDAIMSIAKKYNLVVIEDSCESLGSSYKGKMAGTIGNIGVFGFYPNKQMTTGEGGMLVTDSKSTYNLCKSLTNQGRASDGTWLSYERMGYNYRLDEMSASLGVTQLAKIDRFISGRREIAAKYSAGLSGIPGIVLPTTADNRIHSWFAYVIRITNGRRDAVRFALRDAGIETREYFPAIHLQSFMRERFGFKDGDFPFTESMARETLALPLYIGLRDVDIERITTEIRESIKT